MYTPEIAAKPSVDQMWELHNMSVVLAKDQRRFKASRKTDSAYSFATKQIERLDISDDSEDLSYSLHNYSAKIHKLGYRRWRMRLFDIYMAKDHGEGVDDACRTSYTFEWGHRNVLTAVRKVLAPGQEETESYYVEPPSAAVEQIDQLTGFWAGVKEFETVTAADCGRLLCDMRAFSETSRNSLAMSAS